jgi:hypothetical protein
VHACAALFLEDDVRFSCYQVFIHLYKLKLALFKKSVSDPEGLKYIWKERRTTPRRVAVLPECAAVVSPKLFGVF